MEAHYQFSDFDFLELFQSTRLDPTLFSHEAHLRLAYLHIKEHGIDAAIEHVCHDIMRFVSYHGAKDKFNKTLTIAAVQAVHHFFIRSQTTSFRDFISRNSRLKYHFKDLMDAHYSFDIYSDSKAKATYLEPDVQPFD